MGLWPFGREPEDVQSASRVVSATTRDSRLVRAKLTLHFSDPQTQAEADAAVERCAQRAEALFREVAGHEALLGNEDGLSSALAQRLPVDTPTARSVELAAIHVVGDPGSTTRRRHSSNPAPGGPADGPPVSVPRQGSAPRLPAYASSPPPAGVPLPTGTTPFAPAVVHHAPASGRYPSAIPPHAPGSAPHLPGSASHPPGAASYPPRSPSYPPGSASYPPGAASYPPGSASYPPAAAPHTPIAYPPPPSSRYPAPGVAYTPGASHPPASGPFSPPSTRPPPSAGGRPRRSTSSSIRAISAMMMPPRGAPPSEIAASLAPLLRDAITRLLIGFLRAHDLLIVRQVVLDDTATELLAALLPVSEAPPGEFEGSRAAEIGRWRVALGAPVLDALRAEAGVLGVSLAGLALQQVGIAPAVGAELLEALCRAAAPAAGPTPAPAARYTPEVLLPEAALRVARVLGHPEPQPLEAALAPLLGAVSDDMEILSQLAKVAIGLPA